MITQPSYAVGSWVLLRLMGMIYLAAFLSLAWQATILGGRRGLLPVREFLSERKRLHRSSFFVEFPSLFWWRSTDRTLVGVCIIGVLLSVMLTLGFAPLPILCLLWLCYLSLFNAVPVFLAYQWDVLLLEAGFLCIFLAPWGWWHMAPGAHNPCFLAVLLVWWLLFRLMFFSGVSKLRSSDPSWRKLTALSQHYETQPLPSPLSWFAHKMPHWFHRATTLLTLLIETILPFAIFAPPPLRYVAAGGIVGLMLLILLTGNYGFFNLLAIALCATLIDDDVLGVTEILPPAQEVPAYLIAISVLIFLLSIERICRLFGIIPRWFWPLQWLAGAFEPFRLVNSYGLFTVMTAQRNEIILEGSRNGEEWLEYELRWKPGNVRRLPAWIIPYLPRIDWQMWFAALGEYRANGWLLVLMVRLLEGDNRTLRFFQHNPFPGMPPTYVRAVLYTYRFTTVSERRISKAWWKRERRWLYAPVLSLKGIENHLMPPKDWV